MSNLTQKSCPTPAEYEMLKDMAKNVFESKIYKDIINQSRALEALLYLWDLNVPLRPWLKMIYFQNNSVELSAKGIHALALRAGHQIEIVSLTDTECSLKGTRASTGEVLVHKLTIDDAKKAGFYKESSVWGKRPKAMLMKQCVSELCRWLAPDTIGPLYRKGEVSGIDEDGEEGFDDVEDINPELATPKIVPLTVADLEQKIMAGIELTQAEKEKILPFLEKILESLPIEKLELHVNGWLTDQEKFLTSLHNFMNGKTKRQAELETANRQNSSPLTVST